MRPWLHCPCTFPVRWTTTITQGAIAFVYPFPTFQICSKQPAAPSTEQHQYLVWRMLLSLVKIRILVWSATPPPVNRIVQDDVFICPLHQNWWWPWLSSEKQNDVRDGCTVEIITVTAKSEIDVELKNLAWLNHWHLWVLTLNGTWL